MSLQKLYPFTTAGNYNVPASMEVTGGVCALMAGDTSSLNEDFADDTGFTYDSTKAEFTGGLVRAIDKTPAGFLCGATYTTNANLVAYSVGTVTGTLNGSAAVSGGFLDLTATTGDFVEYTGTANMVMQQTGCIRVIYKPNYSGAPSPLHQYIFSHSSTNNKVYFYHAASTTTIEIRIVDQSGVEFFSQSVTFNPTSGTSYELELNFDVTTGVVEFYQDGTRTGTWTGQTATRSATVANFFLGKSPTTASLDGAIGEFSLYNTVQHTGTSYTPDSGIPETQYLTSKVELPVLTYPGYGSITAFGAFTGTEVDTPKYVFNDKYWNSSAWVTSDGTTAQAITLAVANTNLATLTAADTLYIDVILPAGETLASVSDLTVAYSSPIYSQLDPTGNVVETFSADGLSQFLATETIAGSDLAKYLIKIGATKKYWDGAAWSTSDGTYSQMSTAALLHANLSTIGISAGVTLQIFFGLHSDDGSTTPSIDLIDMLYDFFNVTTTPTVCLMYGEVLDSSKIPIEGAIVSIDGPDFFYGAALISRSVTTTTDSLGKWELDVVETATDSETVDVLIVYKENQETKRKPYTGLIIPNQASKSLGDLVAGV